MMWWLAWIALAVAFIAMLASVYVMAYEARRWMAPPHIAEKMQGGWANLWAWVRGGFR